MHLLSAIIFAFGLNYDLLACISLKNHFHFNLTFGCRLYFSWWRLFLDWEIRLQAECLNAVWVKMLEYLQLVFHISCWRFFSLVFYVLMNFFLCVIQYLTPRLRIRAYSPDVLLNVSILNRWLFLLALINNAKLVNSDVFLYFLALNGEERSRLLRLLISIRHLVENYWVVEKINCLHDAVTELYDYFCLFHN